MTKLGSNKSSLKTKCTTDRVFVIKVALTLGFMLMIFDFLTAQYDSIHTLRISVHKRSKVNDDYHTAAINNITFSQNVYKNSQYSFCPRRPSNLVGPITPNKTHCTLASVEYHLKTKIAKGGFYTPPDCVPRHSVAIIVPYRDRSEQLPVFLNNIHPFLMKQNLQYSIFVVEQTAGNRFNRGTLLNIGVVEALKTGKWDCVVFHDVDLLPLDDRILYSCSDMPRHLSPAVDVLNFTLLYEGQFGGVSQMSVEHFKKINGFSNTFWGWGAEDDDIANRMEAHDLGIIRYPQNISRYTMLGHVKNEENPMRFLMLSISFLESSNDGLNSLSYTLLKVKLTPLFSWFLVKIHPNGIDEIVYQP